MYHQNLRRDNTQNTNVGQVVPNHKIKCHSKLDLESYRVSLRNDEILNQVQDDNYFKGEALNKNTFRAPLRSGFTLIELLVVVLIIGLLAVVALPQYQKAVLKTRFVQMVVLQDAIENAEQEYFLENGKYTANLDELIISLPDGDIVYDETSKWSQYSSGAKYRIRLTEDWSQGYYKEGLSYVRVHGSANKYCRSYTRSDFERSVCLSLGGEKMNCGTCNYDAYKLK